MKRERPEETEEGPNKLQRQSGDLEDATANGSAAASKANSKVRKGTECPYLDTIARQVQTHMEQSIAQQLVKHAAHQGCNL